VLWALHQNSHTSAAAGKSEMPTDLQIALLVEIANSGGSGLRPERLSELVDLIAADYVEGDTGPGERYKLTAKGQGVLDDRGVGANES
jgi:hypothetical protein